jgi:hypothetical protein
MAEKHIRKESELGSEEVASVRALTTKVISRDFKSTDSAMA